MLSTHRGDQGVVVLVDPLWTNNSTKQKSTMYKLAGIGDNIVK